MNPWREKKERKEEEEEKIKSTTNNTHWAIDLNRAINQEAWSYHAWIGCIVDKHDALNYWMPGLQQTQNVTLGQY